jgi:hypothetical protein
VQHAADLAIAGLVLGDNVHGAARLWDEDAPAAPVDPFYLRLERLPSSSLTIFLEAVKVQTNRIVVVRTLCCDNSYPDCDNLYPSRNGSFVPSHPRW